MIKIEKLTRELLDDNANILKQREKDNRLFGQVSYNEQLPFSTKSSIMRQEFRNGLDNLKLNYLVNVISNLCSMCVDSEDDNEINIYLSDEIEVDCDDETIIYDAQNVIIALDNSISSLAERLVDDTYRIATDSDYKSDIELKTTINNLPKQSLGILNDKLMHRRYKTENDDELTNAIDVVDNLVQDKINFFNQDDTSQFEIEI